MTIQESAEAVPIVKEVVVRRALPEERLRWDALILTVPEAQTYYAGNREEAPQLLLDTG